MALIGTIAINMKVGTTQLVKGLARASASLGMFQAVAATEIGKGAKLIGVGFANILGGAKALGPALATIMSNDAKRFYKGLAGDLVRGAFNTVVTKDVRDFVGGLTSKLFGPVTRGFKMVRDGVVGAFPDAKLGAIARAFGTIGKGVFQVTDGLFQMGVGFAKLGLSAGASAVVGSAQLAIAGITGLVNITRNAINELGKFGLILSAVGAVGMWKLAQSAIALGEQTDRARVQFGAFAGGVIAQSKTLATAFGTDQREFIQFASAFSAVFEGAGYQGKAVAELSTHFTRLGLDLASLTHIPVEEALAKIQSGLAGQVRPLREVGVFMSEEGIAAYAAAHHIGKLGQELTESQKIQARAGFITEKLGKAQGNLALTADSGGNSIRGLAGRFENLKESVGTALLGVLVPALGEVQVLIEGLQEAWNNSAIGAANASVGVVGAVQGQAQAIGFVQRAIGFVADAWQALGLGFQLVQSYITAGLAHIVDALAGIASAVDLIAQAAGAGNLGLGDFVKAIGADLHKLSDTQFKEFQTELAKPPSSDGINQYFDNARKKIDDARVAAGKLKTDISQFTPVDTAAAAHKGKDMEFAHAMAYGSSDAANTILRGRAGANGSKGIDTVAKNTGEANILLRQIAGRGQAGGPVLLRDLP